MRKLTLLAFLFSLHAIPSTAQMGNGPDTLVGNEWIDFDRSYFKTLLAQDGIYRISYSELSSLLPANVEANRIRLFYFGEEIPIYTSTEGPMGNGDFIEFFGKKNRSEMDRFLYQDTEALFNPHLSLFTDSSAYFLTWNDIISGERYQSQLNEMSDLPPKEEFYWEKTLSAISNLTAKNKIPGGSNRAEHSHFEDVEGFCYRNLSTDLSTAYPAISLSFPYAPYPDSVPFTIRYAHLSADVPAPVTKTIKLNGVSYASDQFSSFEPRENTFLIPPSLLNAPINLSINGGNQTCMASAEITYPRQFNAAGNAVYIFSLENSDSKKYIEVSNFAHGGVAPVLYDIANEFRLQTLLEDGLVKFALPASAQDRKLVLIHPENGPKTPSPLQPVEFIDYSEEDAEFLIIFNKALAVDGNGTDQVQAYAEYRANSPYYPYSTHTFEIQQLYDQFAYGLQRHTMAIRNFTWYIHKNWSEPKYLLLIGKGLEYQSIRSASQVSAQQNVSFFLPTFGQTGADNLLVSPIGSVDPYFVIGRLPVVSADEIRIYLDKVKSFEAAPFGGGQTIQEKAWMKRLIHLGGGREEQPIIQSYLQGMENVIENNRFGGRVRAFYNTSTDPVVTSVTGEIIDEINEGISILTFFGHSSATVIDFNFDEPDSYDNEGKYPLMLSFGCLSGEMFNTSKGMGERFITAEKKGMIAFISSPGYGFISSLNTLGTGFYSRLGSDLYGHSIGNILKESLLQLDGSGFSGDRILAEQTSIQGDPCLPLNPLPGPDYLTDKTSVQVKPSLLSSSLDSFQLSFDLWNIGQHLPDTTLVLKIEHKMPNEEVYTLLTDTLAAPAFNVPLTYSLPLLPDDEDLVGINRFLITVDSENQIDEDPLAAEGNNEHIGPDGFPGHPVYISSADAEPLYPPDFGIVGSVPVELNASTGYPFAPLLNYRMEIDTTESFNSPFKQSTQIAQSGGIIKWTPDISYQPNRVYYWRISPDSSLTGGYRWRNHSFVYLPGSSPGWNQSHVDQFQYGNFMDLKLPQSTRKLEFIDDVVDFKIRNHVRNQLPGKNPRYFRNQEFPLIESNEQYLNYSGQFHDTLGGGGVFVAVIDTVQIRAIALTNSGADFAPNSKAFLFKTHNTTERSQLINFLQNDLLVPDGYYVLLFTCQNRLISDYKALEWEGDTTALGTSLYQVLAAQGATQVQSLATLGSRPYNLFYRKNRPDFPVYESLGDLSDINELNIPVSGSWSEGALSSPLIGPARKWENLEWELSGWNPDQDDIHMKVWGIRPDGSDTLIYRENVAQKSLPLGDIDAGLFPRIRLEYFAKDPTQKTPPNLEYWRIHFQGMPEAALDASAHFSLQSDTLLQGAPLLLEIATENLSDYGMDSLLVRYTILDGQNQATTLEKRFRPLPAHDTLITHLQYDTRPSTGVHQLTIDINPDGDQPELTHINNVGILQFYVESDQRNPLLDVTFDGMHIADGDLVSSAPLIQVQLKDENPYLALEDTSLFRLLMVHPGGLEERLYFSDERIRFYPANLVNGKNNRARVEFMPAFAVDGLYELFVEAADATGNKTGDINHVVSLSTFGYDYKISFKVITESMISNVLNYPNPFSTSTRFLYTLTGSEPPAYFTIQIFSVSGRVVREISPQEIGQMKIGTHLTDYAWDGRDEFGDPLANGVYLYRIAAKKANGENFKAFTSGADAYFEKGFGKMVIIR